MTSFQPVKSREQITEVARLAREIWQDHYVPIIGQKQVDFMLGRFQSESAIADQLREAYEYFLVMCDGQSAGYVAVFPDGNKRTLLLSKLYVCNSTRGLGLGKSALRFVVDLCRQRGIGMIWLTVNKYNAHSIAWYGRMGFKNAGSIVQEIGEGFVMDDFRMEMELE